MHRIPRHPILILLLAIVLLAPVFEFFDQSQDVDEGADLVLVFLSAFASIGLFILCKRMIYFLLQVFTAAIPAYALLPFRNRSVRIDVSPPECLALLGSLRI